MGLFEENNNFASYMLIHDLIDRYNILKENYNDVKFEKIKWLIKEEMNRIENTLSNIEVIYHFDKI